MRNGEVRCRLFRRLWCGMPLLLAVPVSVRYIVVSMIMIPNLFDSRLMILDSACMHTCGEVVSHLSLIVQQSGEYGDSGANDGAIHVRTMRTETYRGRLDGSSSMIE